MSSTGPPQPPSWAPMPPPAAILDQPAPDSRFGVRRPFWIALFAVGGLLLVAAIIAGHRHNDQPISLQSPQGAQFHASYTTGCQGSGGTAQFCDCLWAELTAMPQYSTLPQLMALNQQAQRANATHNISDMPPAFIAAVRSCRATQGAAPSAYGSSG
jgi:hypothetical protein